jgi:16S rRNA pseudouridine516 synthase
MRSKRSRLDRFISLHLSINRRDVRLMLAQGRITLDGHAATDIHQLVDEFTRVSCDGRLLQANTPVYVMLHKPVGVVSATRDEHHATVIDLLDRPDRDCLHIVGRLDFNSSGLMLLTNDGRWSRHLTNPEQKIVKRYRVTVGKPVSEEVVQAFAQGMAFAFEGITTRPAKLVMMDTHIAEVSLIEGRYHQIKRMFGRFDNPVLALHRLAIGPVQLDPELAPGDSRELTPCELAHSFQTGFERRLR